MANEINISWQSVWNLTSDNKVLERPTAYILPFLHYIRTMQMDMLHYYNINK